MQSTEPANDTGALLKTLLLTDLVDSTKILERLGDQKAFELHGRHDRIARDLLLQHNGREIDKTDGFLLLFERPIDAVGYALAYHQALVRLSAEYGLTLKARAGIHLGEVYVRQNSPEDVARGAKPLEVEGLAKPVAARLMSLAQGGQTLLTAGAHDLAKRAAVDDEFRNLGMQWSYHGRYGFKGVDDVIRVFAVDAAELPLVGPPPDSAKAWRVDRRGRPLARSRRRLPVLIGAAAVLVAALVATFVLTQHGRTMRHRKTVAVLGFDNLKGDSGSNWLSTALSETLTADLAGSEALRCIPGESIARLRNDLELDSLQTLAPDTLELLRQRLGSDLVIAGSYLRSAGSGAIQLKLWAQDGLSGDQVASISEQGTEEELFQLVAATSAALRDQLGIASSAEQSIDLEQSFPSTASGTRLYAQGLEALRASEPQRAADLLERAAALENDSPLVHLALANTWRELGYDDRARENATRAWELTAAATGLGKEQRLQVEGRYAEALGNWETAAEKYAELFAFDPYNLVYGLSLAAAQTSSGNAEGALLTLNRVRKLPPPRGDDPHIDYQESRALRALSRFQEQLEAAERTIQKAEALQARELIARGHVVAGQAYYRLGDAQKATAEYLEARRLFEESGNRLRLAQVINLLATSFLQQGDTTAAEQLFGESLELARRIGDRRGAASSLGNLALLREAAGDLEEAAADFEQVLELFRELGNRAYEAVTLSNLAELRATQGQFAEAETLYNQALKAFEEIGRRSSIASTSSLMGDLYRLRGKLDAAREAQQRAVELFDELGQPLDAAHARIALATTLIDEGSIPEALTAVQAALPVFTDKENPSGTAEAQAVLARALLAHGELGEARSHAEHAQELSSELDDRRLQNRTQLIAARIALASGATEGLRASLDAICGTAAETAGADCLEARLLGAQIDAREGRPEQARRALEQLGSEAGERGFELVRRQVEDALHGLATS